MTELELEKTYLATYLPEGLATLPFERISDVYVPETAEHAVVRLRHKGDTYCITKKIPVSGDDSSRQHEHTIILSREEYEALTTCSNKQFTKRRYNLELGGSQAELDVYEGDLAGLVVIDFEFATDEEMAAFSAPDICLVDVTQDALIAAGKLAGKTYEDIRPQLEAYGYESLSMEGEK